MTHVQIRPSLLNTLKDKVVVLTGGSTGIGRCAVEQFHEHGARVVFGDVSLDAGRELATRLGPGVRFLPCDSSSYTDQLALFREAEQAFGGVDIVVANSGIANHKDIFDPSCDINVEPSMKEIDVNLKGALYTTRIGLHYLRQRSGGDVVLVSSISGFKECVGLGTYTAKTRMVKGIEKGWYERQLPVNEPRDVAESILLCATANRGNSETHEGAVLPFAGKILYVSGGKSYEIEDQIQQLEPAWLGEENSRVLQAGQEYLASAGTSWDVTKGAAGVFLKGC
ncbi:putative 15-hydroxyprostaglandin dehydrogenase [Aspergillus terreus]|uniref:Putative 15-hydroxyprostaglandin dehydrogenase n=1 Tax=Aspergillus terreus TaxID=33178 RepID=A0A5M3Z9R5_ASPTE|nr:hypothetical protein ATETN484_0010025300 [Aspergillus terreus]GFF18300.1 putative 15-hydroxyprostaglandin dehydrogenase [Aspergillus terreus]